MERMEREISGLYCTAASSAQLGSTLVEPAAARRTALRQRRAAGRAIGLRGDQLVAQQVALHQAHPQGLAAADGVHQPRREAGRDLVRVGHPVDTREGVVAYRETKLKSLAAAS
jgi:hypothetical protein